MTTRHPTARRIHRQETGTDDAFVANVLHSSAWAREHARTLIIATVAIAAVVIAAVVVVSQRRASFERATQELTPLRALAQTGQPQVVPQLESYLQQHGGTKPAREARLLLAQQYLAAGQGQKALEVVEPIGMDFEDPVAVNAAYARAAAYETLGEPHRAEEIYLEVGDEARFRFQQHDALDNVARIRMARGDAAGAAEIYQRLHDGTPDTEAIKQVWAMRLAEARAAVESGAAATGAAATPSRTPPPASTPTMPGQTGAPAGAAGQPPAPTTTTGGN